VIVGNPLLFEVLTEIGISRNCGKFALPLLHNPVNVEPAGIKVALKIFANP
jgi:hypothetical protein